MASSTISMPIMPCGPPKPRKAVLETVLVRQRCEVMVDVLEEIAVVRMEHGPIGDGAGEVGGAAAVGGLHELDAEDAALAVEADVVVDHGSHGACRS